MRPSVIWLLAAVSAVLLCIPWLLPHTGYVLLVALFPLLVADQLASTMKYRHFWWCHYSCFVFWNAVTTFWVCNANVGGGIFGGQCLPDVAGLGAVPPVEKASPRRAALCFPGCPLDCLGVRLFCLGGDLLALAGTGKCFRHECQKHPMVHDTVLGLG